MHVSSPPTLDNNIINPLPCDPLLHPGISIHISACAFVCCGAKGGWVYVYTGVYVCDTYERVYVYTYERVYVYTDTI
jgi:hypothetical protein